MYISFEDDKFRYQINFISQAPLPHPPLPPVGFSTNLLLSSKVLNCTETRRSKLINVFFEFYSHLKAFPQQSRKSKDLIQCYINAPVQVSLLALAWRHWFLHCFDCTCCIGHYEDALILCKVRFHLVLSGKKWRENKWQALISGDLLGGFVRVSLAVLPRFVI